MANQQSAKRKRTWEFEDFKAVLDLPERCGAQCLRELLHISVTDWRLCMDKIRQRKEGKEEGLPQKQRLYHEYRKSKGPGKGYRYFAAPHPILKQVQHQILYRFLDPIRVHFCRHGNQRGASILTNAEQHAGFALTMFNVDIINAFPTVTRARVRANLRRPFVHALREFGMDFKEDEMANMLESLVDLMVLRDRLPQGPPTSPRVLDICCRQLDRDLFGLLRQSSTPVQEYRFTAYVDDFTISSNGEIPLAMREAVIKRIRKRGFIPHSRPDKCHYYSPETGEVLSVTGLLVWQDGRITIPPEKLKLFRSRLYELLRRKHWDDEARGQVTGTLAFIAQFYEDRLPSDIRPYVEQCRERIRQDRLAALPSTAASSATQSRSSKPAGEKKKSPRKRLGNGHAHDVAIVFEGVPATTAGPV